MTKAQRQRKIDLYSFQLIDIAKNSEYPDRTECRRSLRTN